MTQLKPMSGFTLIQLILTMIIMAILAVAAVPKLTPEPINLQYEARRVLADIRYTQSLSMFRGERYRWVRTSATTYQILNQAGTAMVFPMGGTTQTLTTGISFGTFSNLPNNLIAFDTDGTPYTTSTIPGTALTSTASITFTAGSVTQTIQISPQTGRGVLI